MVKAKAEVAANNTKAMAVTELISALKIDRTKDQAPLAVTLASFRTWLKCLPEIAYGFMEKPFSAQTDKP